MNWISGINHWAMPGVPAREAATMARQAGFETLELNMAEMGEVSLDTDDASAHALRSSIESEGMKLYSMATGLYWQYSPTSDDASVRQKSRDIAKRQISLAAEFGLEAVLIVPGQVGSGMGAPMVRYDIAYDRAAEFAAEIAPIAESAGVDIGIENVWNKLLLSPLEMQRFVDAPGSERFGVYFDVGNILLYGYPEHWIDILGNRIRKIHLKDFKQSVGTIRAFVDIGTGDVNWEAVGGALKRTGYTGPLTAEVSPSREEQADLPGYLAKVCGQVRGVMSRMESSQEVMT